MNEDLKFGFTWRFLDEISWWALGMTTLVCVIAVAVYGDVPFALGCAIASVLDVGLVRMAAARGRAEVSEGRMDTVASGLMLGGRLIVKVALLALSLVAGEFISFAGTVVGVLIYDLTLAFVGSVLAASRLMRHGRQGG